MAESLPENDEWETRRSQNGIMAVEQATSLEGLLARQSTQETKHEYDLGRVIPHDVAVPGGCEPHHEIELTLIREIANVFEDSPFRPYASDRLIVDESGEVAYFPDAVLMDGPAITRRYGTQQAATHPAAVFEIALFETGEARIVRRFRAGETWREGGDRGSERAADGAGSRDPRGAPLQERRATVATRGYPGSIEVRRAPLGGKILFPAPRRARIETCKSPEKTSIPARSS